MTFCGMRACGRLAMSAVAPTEMDQPGLVRVQLLGMALQRLLTTLPRMAS
jgi:hypothetical protein